MNRKDDDSNHGKNSALEAKKRSLEKVLAYSRDFIQLQNKELDFPKITEDFLEISRGKFAAFNLYDDRGENFTTEAIAGDEELIQLGVKLAGLCCGRMTWNHDEAREQKMRGKTTTRFSSVADLAGGVLSRNLVKKAAKRLNIGETVVIKIMNKEKTLGDFTVFMGEGESFDQQEIAEIFSNQVGMVLERQKVEKQLSEQNRLFTRLSQQVPGAFFQARLKNAGELEFLFISDGVQELCEVSPEEVRRNPPVVFSHIHPEDFQRVKGTIEKSAAQLSIWEVEYRVVLPTKGERWLKGSARPEKLADGSVVWHGYINDFTENVRRQKKIEYLSIHDDLTGLYNRRYMESMEKHLDREENLPLAYFYMDLNGLKLNNDAFGHEKGDELLKLVAKILKNNCREQDTVARVGGDEFSILLPRTSKEQADNIAKRIQEEISKAKMEPVMVSIALGFAVKTKVQEQMGNIKSIAEKRMYKNKRQNGGALRTETIDMILQSIEEKHKKEEIHSLRVGEYTGKIGRSLGMKPRDLEKLKRVSYLHDIGKVMVSPEILNKADKLTEEEYEVVRQHPEIGYQILKSLEEYADMSEIVLYHHERWDGKGYPQGLKKEEIPLESRIINIADAYEAMTADRPYRGAKTKEAALKELQRCAGSQFDPELVRLFIENTRR
ncbi:bifunctional diguanylate cyclase/phosphohydrolase [Isachenkonia alkalipeptolytica]|uniref:Diguanylate cyclase n=1 Tax=Isachenkonia alkalipeptolytica TaxID=2565777 RepID=A0AA43XL23_9CLOT|nr:HD domain-containing phosphohydrolase [Isachenkonia alkalipeptolytica]NBG88281.1 diguanylate cyclase [Isachenkonia alkalipeptolytica]